MKWGGRWVCVNKRGEPLMAGPEIVSRVTKWGGNLSESIRGHRWDGKTANGA